MKLFSQICILLFLSFFFFQCQKDLSYIGSPDSGVSGVPSDPITTTLQGNIVDENNQPAAGVSITVGTKTVMTNGSGYFRITDASLDKNTSLVTAQKEGYFKGYRVFAATSGTNQIVIKLIKKTLAGTVSASAGGTAVLSNGAKISLPADGIVAAASGSDYSGDVNIYAAYIDPTANDIAETVPGSFAANDKSGKRVVLSSYGMLAVELESAAGEKLQIRSGAVATLTNPIPSATLSSAPATIALWYVDEQTGVWKEEGTATKQGNNYVGDVKHFSFWNCDYPYDAVSISVTFLNDKGQPLVNVPVNITPTNQYGSAHGYTDSLGQIKGLVPANEDLLMEVLSPCGLSVYSQNIPSLNKNTDLGVVKIPNSTPSLLTFSGILLDCSGVPVQNGYAIITLNNMVRYAATDASGKYATTLIICSGTPTNASVLGVDETSRQQSLVSSVMVIAPLTDAGNITACGTSSEQFINYTLDGTSHYIGSAISDSIVATNYNFGIDPSNEAANETYIEANFMTPRNAITFVVDGAPATGTFPIKTLNVHTYVEEIITRPFDVTFTSYPKAVGEFYEGSFSGKFTDSASATLHEISSTFKVRRTH